MHNCTLKHNGDSIIFKQPTSSQFYKVTYFFGYDSYTEVKTCTVNEAQSRWDNAIEMGFKEYETNGEDQFYYLKNSRYDF